MESEQFCGAERALCVFELTSTFVYLMIFVITYKLIKGKHSEQFIYSGKKDMISYTEMYKLIFMVLLTGTNLVYIMICAYQQTASFHYVVASCNIFIWVMSAYLIKQEHLYDGCTSKIFRNFMFFPIIYFMGIILAFDICNQTSAQFYVIWSELLLVLVFYQYIVAYPNNFQLADIEAHMKRMEAQLRKNKNKQQAQKQPKSILTGNKEKRLSKTEEAQLSLQVPLIGSPKRSSPSFPAVVDEVILDNNYSYQIIQQTNDQCQIRVTRNGISKIATIQFDEFVIFVHTIKIRHNSKLMQTLFDLTQFKQNNIWMKILELVQKEQSINYEFGAFLQMNNCNLWTQQYFNQNRMSLQSFCNRESDIVESILAKRNSSFKQQSQQLIHINFMDENITYLNKDQQQEVKSFGELGLDANFKEQIEAQLKFITF